MVERIDTMVESLGAVGRELMVATPQGLAMQHVRGEHRTMQQTVMALAATQCRTFEGGAAEATMLVLQGAVEVASSGLHLEASGLDLVELPIHGEWSVAAHEDAVLLFSWLDPSDGASRAHCEIHGRVEALRAAPAHGDAGRAPVGWSTVCREAWSASR
ncbi:hypothetical protein LG314_05495 [Agrococcus terreus]|uniref:hypothetical protein n=1 Tax=Agrococcus terreus TaxID=574649 RepID=UPI00384E0ADD